MKMKKYIQSMMAFAAIVSFASCSSEDNTTIENESAVKVMTFTATQEGDEQSTRAAISSADSKVINWEEGDKISLLYGSKNKEFSLIEGAGSTVGKFSGVAEQSTSYTAVYPYQPNASLSGTNVTNVNLPATQNATDNSFDKNAALMMAQSNSTTLEFKNVVGYVKVKPNFDCKRIDLKAFDNSAVLAGTGRVSYNGGEPTLNLSKAPTKDYAITLQGEIKADNYYYIAVPPVTLKAGWTIKFTASDGTVYSRKGTNPITFTRNKVTNLGVFDIDGKYWYNPSGNVTSDKEVDLGLTITIGTKNYKVIFAKSNLTTTGLAASETAYGDYFAWGAKEPWYVSYQITDGKPKVEESNWEKSGGYIQANAPLYDGSSYTKYTTDEKTLEASDDAANVILGGDWQIPTQAIWQALVNNLSSKGWDDVRKGYTFTNNGQTLFLPAAGYVEDTQFNAVGSDGYYWSGTVYWSPDAYYLQFNYSEVRAQSSWDRYSGYSVRPVRLVAVD